MKVNRQLHVAVSSHR